MPFKTFPVYAGLAILVGFSACHKSSVSPPAKPGNPVSAAINYGDSVFYLNAGSAVNTIQPEKPGNGEYWGFPEGIEIDSRTGTIDLAKSETGLHYKIYFKAAGSTDTLSTIVLISGINYFDKIYNLSKQEYNAVPVYNGDPSRPIPGVAGNTVFDEDDKCNGQGIAVSKSNGVIDLPATIRNGTFGQLPASGSSLEVDLKYRIQDKSNGSANHLKVKIYYYDSSADIAADLKQLIADREGTIFKSVAANPSPMQVLSRASGLQKAAKPRPPCIIIVSH